jgi:ABC-2 type transport system permease protein
MSARLDPHAIWALAERELKRFVRQRNRVWGALAQPIVFWGIFGIGLSASFRPAGMSADTGYVEYFFPGTVILILLFTAIFATISIIEDRSEGFLQAVIVAPVSTQSIVMGKLVGTTILAVGQALLVFALAPLAGIDLSVVGFLLATVLLFVIAFGLAALGFTIAWRTESTQGFHAIMMAFLMPMWFLSGAFFPASGLPGWLGWIIRLNPLTYGLAAFRRALYLLHPDSVGPVPELLPSLAVLCLFTLVMFVLAVRTANADRTTLSPR